MSRPLVRQVTQTHRLVVFDAVVRTGSFTAAAEELGVTQPAVSRHVALLEDELGLQLFRRGLNRATPTDDGVTLAGHVDTGFRHIEEGLAALVGRDEVLTVAVQPAIAEAWFSPRLDEAREALEPSQLRLVIFEDDRELITIDHDVAVRFGRGRHPGTRSQLLVPEVAQPLVSPRFAERHGLSAESPAAAFLGLRLMEATHAGAGWLTWQDWFWRQGIDWAGSDETVSHRNYASVLQLALAGHGVVIGWRGLQGYLREEGLLVPVGPRAFRPEFGYRLVWPTGFGRRQSVQRLRAWLTATVQQQVADDPLDEG